eukprot:snap_masked-scaffold_3-processed-gene-13.5-mRNA-1 protein AED:1.00 eAED:1.00 QI:0/-1/0/0/-1/1/1/0/84
MSVQYKIASPYLLTQAKTLRKVVTDNFEYIDTKRYYDIGKVKICSDHSMHTAVELMNLSMTATVVVQDKLVIPCYYDLKFISQK